MVPTCRIEHLSIWVHGKFWKTAWLANPGDLSIDNKDILVPVKTICGVNNTAIAAHDQHQQIDSVK